MAAKPERVYTDLINVSIFTLRRKKIIQTMKFHGNSRKEVMLRNDANIFVEKITENIIIKDRSD